MSEPLVSIVIPCYNGESYIAEAINSALAQTYPHTEVVVIDDGSTDNSREVIGTFGDAIRWQAEPNRGGAAARNLGVSVCRGEFVQFLDADDVLLADKLSKQVPLAMAEPQMLAYTDHYFRGDAQQSRLRRGRTVTAQDPFIFVLEHRTLTVSGPLYPRSWLNQIGGFRDGMPASQEFEMNLRLGALMSSLDAQFVHIDEPLFEVRRRQGSVSCDTAKTLAALADPLEELAAEGTALDANLDTRRAAFAVYCASIGRLCLRGGEREAGLRLIALGERVDKEAAERSAWGGWSRIAKRAFGAEAVENLAALRSKLRGRKSMRH